MNSTKRAIQTTFIDLYRKKSYDQMNVKELCVQTPVARTTFYEYYDNLGTLKAEIEDELIGGILKIAKATAGGSFVEMNLNVFFAQTLDYIKSHWEENYAFLVAQPNLAYIAKWKDAIKYHFRLRFPEKDAVPNHGLIMEVIASAVIGAYTNELVGDYYVPDLKLPEERRPIGHWGRLHQSYLKLHRPMLYNELILSGRLHTVVADLNEQAADRLDLIIRQMMKAEGVTEAMKAENQMLWVQSMNSIRCRAEEIIKTELIYC